MTSEYSWEGVAHYKESEVKRGGTMNDFGRKEAEEKVKQLQREYQREWRKKNPGKQAEYNRRYWFKKLSKASWGLSSSSCCKE